MLQQNLAEDEALMDVFRSGGNFHSTIAHKVFKLPCEVEEVAELYSDRRQAAKAVTFGIMYGAGPAKISEQVTKDSGKYFSRQEASEVIKDYFGAFHKLRHGLIKIKNLLKLMDLSIVSLAERGDCLMLKVPIQVSEVIAFALALIFWFSLLLVILTY